MIDEQALRKASAAMVEANKEFSRVMTEVHKEILGDQKPEIIAPTKEFSDFSARLVGQIAGKLTV